MNLTINNFPSRKACRLGAWRKTQPCHIATVLLKAASLLLAVPETAWLGNPFYRIATNDSPVQGHKSGTVVVIRDF